MKTRTHIARSLDLGSGFISVAPCLRTAGLLDFSEKLYRDLRAGRIVAVAAGRFNVLWHFATGMEMIPLGYQQAARRCSGLLFRRPFLAIEVKEHDGVTRHRLNAKSLRRPAIIF